MRALFIIFLMCLSGCAVVQAPGKNESIFMIIEALEIADETKNTMEACKSHMAWSLKKINKTRLYHVPNLIFIQYSVGTGVFQGLYIYEYDSDLILADIFSKNKMQTSRRKYNKMIDSLPKQNILFTLPGEKMDGSCFYLYIARTGSTAGFVFDGSAYFVEENKKFLMQMESYFNTLDPVQSH